MKLISMTDFVLSQLGNEDKGGHMNYHDSLKVLNYAKFLKQPLKLEMFVPCDEEGNVLEFPLDVNCLKYGKCTCGSEDYEDCKEWKKEKKNEILQYEKAKEKVLFEGFEFSGNGFFTSGEDYLISQYEEGKFKWLVNEGRYRSTFYKVENIEGISNLGGGIILTPSALKQIGI